MFLEPGVELDLKVLVNKKHISKLDMIDRTPGGV